MSNFHGAALLLLVTVTRLFSTDINFNGTHAYSVPAYAIAIGDFNKDGNPDVVSGGHNMFFLAGRGDGRFQEPVQIATGPGPASTAMIAMIEGDFNHDGNADVLAVYYTNPATIVVLLGNGDGTFRPPATYTAGGFPTAVVAVDLNGDHNVDLAFTNYSGTSHAISVLTGSADGTFQAAVHIPLGSGVPVSLAAGDFNGDSAIDLAVGSQNKSAGTAEIDFFLNNGTASFHAGTSVPISRPLQASAMAAGDFNGDGKLDLVFGVFGAGSGGGIYILEGAGDGTFPSGFEASGALIPGDIVVVDINHDGILDLVVGSQPGVSSAAVLLGAGNGLFNQLGDSGFRSMQVVAVADVNNDSKLDVISGSIPPSSGSNGESPAYLKVSLGNGDGTFDSSVLSTNCCSAVAADFNKDGKQDLAFSWPCIELGNGNATFQPAIFLPAFGPFAGVVMTGDLNLDGNPDLVAGVLGGSQGVAVYLGNGDGTFRSHYYPMASEVTAIAMGDLNNDGIPDLILTVDGTYTNSPSGLALLFGAGNGTFGAPVYESSSQKLTSLVTADLNGDHRPDLAILTAPASPSDNASITLLLSQANGTLKAQSILLGVGWKVGMIVASDLNGDGLIDLALSFADPQISGVVTFIGTGGGSFSYSAYYSDLQGPHAQNPVLFTFADIDGDHIPDLVTLRNNTDVAVLRGRSDGTFIPSTELYGLKNGGGGGYPVAADFNQDSKIDLLLGGPVLLNMSQ